MFLLLKAKPVTMGIKLMGMDVQAHVRKKSAIIVSKQLLQTYQFAPPFVEMDLQGGKHVMIITRPNLMAATAVI